MLENILVFIFISVLVFSSKNEQSMGWLVFCYYAVYILLELDFFGYTAGHIITTHQESVVWYLIYTSISLLFLIASLIIFIFNGPKIALFYACWILFNMFITGLSAILQSFETNMLLFVYNVIQNINLIVDIAVVLLGTDHIIKREFDVAANIINNINDCADRWLSVFYHIRNKGT